MFAISYNVSKHVKFKMPKVKSFLSLTLMPVPLFQFILPPYRNEFKQRFGVSVSFLATHSGLLRWQDYNAMGEEIRPEYAMMVLD